jgi:hypothetical protein
VTRESYAGSAACAGCHPKERAAWERSPMHRMTRDAASAEIAAPFDGTRWRFKGDSVVLERRAGVLTMRIEPAQGPATTYRVRRVIGGRTREDFTGTAEGSEDEEVLPVSYVFGTHSLRYKGYSVMVHERQGLRAGPVWSRACIFCHNTVPELDRMLGAIAGPSAGPYQAEQVDRWLAPDRRTAVRVLDAGGFARAAAGEAARLGEPSFRADGGATETARGAIDVVRSHFAGDSLVEVGIGCEACHGGSLEHVRAPERRPSLVPAAAWFDVEGPDSRASQINRVCARCHQVLFTRYPFTWEGGRRNAGAGGSYINSGEGRDFLLGGCSSQLACTACHDPHGGGERDGRGPSAANARDRVCLTCHGSLATPERVREHTHHDPNGPGSSCVACHMPRKNMGLDGTLTAYHRIGSPTDPARVLGDRPLECALCHADKNVGSLVDAMQTWWPVRYPSQRLIELYGSLDANVMEATVARGEPHEQAVAMAVLGEARAVGATAVVGSRLLSEFPLVRQWALRALVAIRGRCDVDLGADDATIAEQARASCGVVAASAPPRAAEDEPPED